MSYEFARVWIEATPGCLHTLTGCYDLESGRRIGGICQRYAAESVSAVMGFNSRYVFAPLPPTA